MKANDFDWTEGTVTVLGKGNEFRKTVAGNGVIREWFENYDSLGITAHGIQTMLERLSMNTGIHCNPHSFR